MGFTESKGLGDSATTRVSLMFRTVKGLRPDVEWFADVFTRNLGASISTCLGSLSSSFLNKDSEDEKALTRFG